MSDVIQPFVPENLREIADGLALLRLPPNLRRRLLARMGRMTIAQARKNVREQKTVDGSAMEPRKRKPPKTRKVYHKDGRITSKKTHAEMLHDIVRSKWLGVKADEDRATVFFFRNAGYVGYKHQTGASEAFERIKAEDAFPVESRDPHFREFWKPCTEAQAVALSSNGFPQSAEWCKEHLKQGDAFRILTKTKGSWEITVPARPFLGVSDERKRLWGKELLAGIYGKFKAKNHANLLT